MSFVLDTIMECITVQNEMEKSKNILVSNIYRKPGSNIDMFKEKIAEIFSNSNNKKMGFICRDSNIDLLNPQEHNKTLSSLIWCTVPVCIPQSFDQPELQQLVLHYIFTNVFEHKVESGLIINDVSDHLPVFANIHSYTKTRKQNIHNDYPIKYEYIQRRFNETRLGQSVYRKREWSLLFISGCCNITLWKKLLITNRRYCIRSS